MPTRENQTTITIGEDVRKMLDYYREENETWDNYFKEMIKFIEEHQ